jgi:hypothetical protein
MARRLREKTATDVYRQGDFAVMTGGTSPAAAMRTASVIVLMAFKGEIALTKAVGLTRKIDLKRRIGSTQGTDLKRKIGSTQGTGCLTREADSTDVTIVHGGLIAKVAMHWPETPIFPGKAALGEMITLTVDSVRITQKIRRPTAKRVGTIVRILTMECPSRSHTRPLLVASSMEQMSSPPR